MTPFRVYFLYLTGYHWLNTGYERSRGSPWERWAEGGRVKRRQEGRPPRRQQDGAPRQQGRRRQQRRRRPRALALLTLHLPAGRTRFRDNLDGWLTLAVHVLRLATPRLHWTTLEWPSGWRTPRAALVPRQPTQLRTSLKGAPLTPANGSRERAGRARRRPIAARPKPSRQKKIGVYTLNRGAFDAARYVMSLFVMRASVKPIVEPGSLWTPL